MTAKMSLDEIYDEIRKMGYITVKPIDDIKPSVYRLTDGTIIMVSVKINHLLSSPAATSGFEINSTNTVMCYVKKKHRHPGLHDPDNTLDPQSRIVEEDIELETLQENFNSFVLSNGMILSVKPVVGQVNKTDLYNPRGELIYTVSATPVIKIKTSSRK